jgi:hypothetical protein
MVLIRDLYNRFTQCPSVLEVGPVQKKGPPEGGPACTGGSN